MHIHGDKTILIFFSLQYDVDLFVSLKVSLITGIVMGGGAGLSMNSMFRVVTEDTVFFYPLFIIL